MLTILTSVMTGSISVRIIIAPIITIVIISTSVILVRFAIGICIITTSIIISTSITITSIIKTKLQRCVFYTIGVWFFCSTVHPKTLF